MSRKGSADLRTIPHTRINDESWIWENYEPGEKIGQGTFGKVFKVKHKETGKYWAIKVINKEKVQCQGHTEFDLLFVILIYCLLNAYIVIIKKKILIFFFFFVDLLLF